MLCHKPSCSKIKIKKICVVSYILYLIYVAFFQTFIVHFYNPALKKWGLYWICPVLLWFCHSVTFQIKIFVTLSQELWGLEGWNLVHTWTMGGCIMCTGIRLLLLFVPLFLHFSFSPIFKQNFSSHFSQELWGLEGCILPLNFHRQQC